LKGTDTAAIKSASEKLNEVWQSVSGELYKAASEKAQAGRAGGGPGPEGGPAPGGSRAEGDSTRKDENPIIDAEVVDEKKT
jgi:molecular chaperone DnaK